MDDRYRCWVDHQSHRLAMHEREGLVLTGVLGV